MPAIRATFERLKRRLMRRGASHEDAEDFIQEAFARLVAYQQRSDVRDSDAFLARTALNLATDEGRRRQRRRIHHEPVENQAEINAFEAQAAALSDAQRSAQQQALMQRVQALQAQTAHSSREVDATRAAAMTQIADAAQPVIAEVYASKACGLLFDRSSALGGNFGNDLTAGVVAALDARLPTVTVERVRLPQEQAGAH